MTSNAKSAPDMKGLLTRSNVRFNDLPTVERKILKLHSEGADKCRIFSDFDRTLSRNWCSDGKLAYGSYSLFICEPKINSSLAALDEKYLPIEFNTGLSAAQKAPHMEKWWRESNALICSAKLTRADIQRLIATAKLELRAGTDTFLEILGAKHVPMLIFSAGVDEVIRQVIVGLKTSGFSQLPNMDVIANRIDFDSSGVIASFKEPLVHVYSKNSPQTRIAYAELINKYPERRNFIVLGDSVGDATMADGLSESPDSILKIGFLNDKTGNQKKLENHLSCFDVVVIDDESMDVVCEILNFCLQ